MGGLRGEATGRGKVHFMPLQSISKVQTEENWSQRGAKFIPYSFIVAVENAATLSFRFKDFQTALRGFKPYKLLTNLCYGKRS